MSALHDQRSKRTTQPLKQLLKLKDERKKNTFFDMFSKLGLLMREKASRKTSAPR